MKFGELIDLVNSYQALERMLDDNWDAHPADREIWRQKIEEMRERELKNMKLNNRPVPNTTDSIYDLSKIKRRVK